jgi:sulfatase maturation enzyme AslB (radical SAM superfamily)
VSVRASGSTYGTCFRVTTFGESHGKGVGCVVDGGEQPGDKRRPAVLGAGSHDAVVTAAQQQQQQRELQQQGEAAAAGRA